MISLNIRDKRFYILIAEIYNKIVNNQEDELTGNFFGNLRYLDYHKFLLPILQNAMRNNHIFYTEQLFSRNKEIKFEFWKRSKNYGEIDACFYDEDNIVGIEVKLYSGLSSEDQLFREGQMLNEWGKEKKKFLIFISPDRDLCLEVYDENKDKLKSINVNLLWCTWYDLYNSLKLIETSDNLVISDIKDLMIKKGFEGFQSFDNIVNKDIVWESIFLFKEQKRKFTFASSIRINKEAYYEFK